jgi:hypothetical protein
VSAYTFKGQCELCDTPQLVRVEITRYAIKEGGYWFDPGARCIDRKACRARVEAAGNPWLVIDPKDLVSVETDR